MYEEPKEREDGASMHPLYLLKEQIANKSLKKSSLQEIQTIALCLGKQRCKNQLIPFLIKLYTQETLEYKSTIMKGMSKLVDKRYLNKHGIINVLSFTIDVLCVYSQKEMREEACFCLDKIMKTIDVQKAQTSILNAIMKLALCLQNKEMGSPETRQNIKQTAILLISYIYNVRNETNEQQIISLVRSLTGEEKDRKYIAYFIQKTVDRLTLDNFTQELLEILIASENAQLTNKIISPLIKIGQKVGGNQIQKYFEQIMKFCNDTTYCLLLDKLSHLAKLLPEAILQPVYEKIEKYQQQPQEIKNAVLEKLDKIEMIMMDSERRDKIVAPETISNSVKLKTTLIETLCRLSNNAEKLQFSSQSLKKLLLHEQISKDLNFLIKIFPKLPPIISELHAQILSKILNSKSWRQKLTVLDNLKQRIIAKEPAHLLFNTLLNYTGDKIASVRIAIVSVLGKILCTSQSEKIQCLRLLSNKLQSSQTWYERQSIYFTLKEYLQFLTSTKESNLSPGEKELLMAFQQRSKQQSIVNITIICKQIWDLMSELMI